MTTITGGVYLTKAEAKTIESALMILQSKTRRGEDGQVEKSAQKPNKKAQTRLAAKSFIDRLPK